VPDIVGVIMEEERKAFHLLQSAPLQVHRVISRVGVTGESLAILHHTHGYDPETVACIIDVPGDCITEYHAAMDAERERSRDSLKREQVMARI
jgi:alanyl-tRNA synthetase